MLVLLLESNARGLKRALEKKGFQVDIAADGAEADRKTRDDEPAIVVLEREMLNGEGLLLVKKWRAAGVKAHVLIVTANGGLQAKLDAFSFGADDCVTKPYELDELLARLGTSGRSTSALHAPVLQIFDLEIDLSVQKVKRGGKPIRLTPREFDLLQFLIAHRGKPVSRTMIWEHLYDGRPESRSNVVDVYIRYLRKKLDSGFEPALILTCWGKGYMLRGADA